MNFTFTPETAAMILKIVSPFVVVGAGYVFMQTTWDKRLKIAAVFIMSALLGALTSFSEGKVDFTGNFWDNFTNVFASSQMVYWAIMKGLGLEKKVDPTEAAVSKVADEARQEAAKQLGS